MDPRYTQYLEQHHIQDLWDGLVAAYIKQHGDHLSPQQPITGGVNKDVVASMKTYLQSVSETNAERRKNSRYVIILDDSSYVNTVSVSQNAALRYVQYLCETGIAKSYLSHPWPLPIPSQESHTDADIEQRKVEKARLNAIKSIRASFENLPPSEDKITVLLASSWPRSIADVLLLEREIGDPLMVTLFESANVPEDDRGHASFENTDREIREAGTVNPHHERAAFIDYCDAKGYLTRVKVEDKGDNFQGLMTEQANALMKVLRS